MDEIMNTFNVEAGAFLHYLRLFNDIENAAIGEKTLAVLMDIVTHIEKVVANKPHSNSQNETDLSFLLNLDRRQFELRQNIICRVCSEPISISQAEFQNHLQKSSHVQRLENFSFNGNFSPKQQTNHSSKKTNDNQIDLNDNATASEKKEFVGSPITKPEKPKIVVQKQDAKVIESQNLYNRYYAQALSDSDDSWEPSIRDFNFDSKHLIELRGLPWTSTKEDVKHFLQNVNILNGLNGIHFILEDKHVKNGRAFVQLDKTNDFISALKIGGKTMNDRYIEVLTGDVREFTHLVNKRKIPLKERVIFMERLPPEYTEQDIRLFFTGISIDIIEMVPNTTTAFVKFNTSIDVELALKKTNNDSEIRVYRSTENEMQSHRKKPNIQPLQPLRRFLPKTVHNPNNNNSVTEFLKVRGLSIDQRKGIKMERDKKGRFAGVAYVAFNNFEDFEFALNVNLSKVNEHIKVSRATQMELDAVQSLK